MTKTFKSIIYVSNRIHQEFGWKWFIKSYKCDAIQQFICLVQETNAKPMPNL